MIVEGVLDHLASCAQEGAGVLLLETAGGVHSPTPSGNSQVDAYQPLRFPIHLMADHRLGGISSSISAYESLRIRGYDLDSVMVFEENYYKNHEYLRQYFNARGISLIALPRPPARRGSDEEDRERMAEYYEKTSRLDAVQEMTSNSYDRHHARIERLESMAQEAHQTIWYPFTQHRDLPAKDIMTIDSANGDFFQTYRAGDKNAQEKNGLLQPTFDGSASWWTQGIGHGSPELSMAASYAAGRYGHVMFAGTVHEPALGLAQLLLRRLANPRLQKVFYSDNGSTGTEVATKMALTAACKRYDWDVHGSDVTVLGLKGSYHGDTVGAMDLAEPSTFNEKVHWYQGRGYWFDFPQVKMVDGTWHVEPPVGMEDEFGSRTEFPSLSAIFDVHDRDASPARDIYERYIEKTLRRLVEEEGKTFGALIMEPVILGAGGMLLAYVDITPIFSKLTEDSDPLFQRCLVRVVRQSAHIFGSAASPDTTTYHDSQVNRVDWTGLPVIFDEVFTGLYRLGHFSAASLLDVHPDISVHAKLLTGGLLPLCTTIASDSIFEAFLGTEKSDALLHGHSYTAHAVGCEVAKTTLQLMSSMEKGEEWQRHRRDWVHETEEVSPAQSKSDASCIFSSWSKAFVTNISHAEDVESVFALGSVLAINLRDNDAAGKWIFSSWIFFVLT